MQCVVFANLIGEKLEYKVIELIIEVGDNSVLGIVPNRPMTNPGTTEQFGKVRRGYFFFNREHNIKINMATS